MSKIIKRYKTCPRHKYWSNGHEIQKVEHMANDWVYLEWVDLENHKKDGRIISGYNLIEGFKKATEEEWNEALLNAL